MQVSLDTESHSLAAQRASSFNLILEAFWQSLDGLNSDEAQNEFRMAVNKSKLCGFQYRPQSELIDSASFSEFANRINVASQTDDRDMKMALLGGIQLPSISLYKALEEYCDYEIGNQQGMSKEQLRKWKNPRKKAVRNFIKVIGNKNVAEITRNDVMEFRNWWVDRIERENLASNSANKDFGCLRRILSVVTDNNALDINVDALFRRVSLKKMEKTKRHPFSKQFIKDVLLRPLGGLNEESCLLIYAMCDTGARIGELVGLENEDIMLVSEIPHIKIRPNSIRTLKTTQSERDLPLVGASLMAFKKLEGAFKRYQGKPDLISTTINKYFRETNLLPSMNHSLYSLRHSFEDRLTSVEPPEKVQAAIMGHKYSRPRYGLGPSLEQKKSWLEKIAFDV